ncbi:MAG: GNAT family N-acetyltransferase [Pseudomonadota bacterium]
MSVTFRDATEADATLIDQMTLENETYICSLDGSALAAEDRKPWGEIFLREAFGETPCFSCRIAERDGAAVGYYNYHFGYDADHALRTLFLPDVYVRAGARRQGVGRALMADAAKQARVGKAGMIRWSVWCKNPRAIAFYEAIGATVYREEFPTYWPEARWPVD